MNKKHFTIFCIVILAIIGNLTSCAAKANTAEMEQQSKSTITWIEDKPGPTLNETSLFPGVPDSLWQSLGLEKGVPASMSCFLLQSDGKNILFDTGLGAPFSRLLPQLAEMGLTPDSIDVIFLTHFHGDHIGGMMHDGKPVFTKAKVYANKVEADAWRNMSDGKGTQAIAMMEAYKNNLHLFTAGDTLENGIATIAAYGHTPGHTAFQKDSILIVGDLMHGVALQEKYPEFCARYDMDPAAAVEARKRILDYAKANGLTMYGMHFPPPAK